MIFKNKNKYRYFAFFLSILFIKIKRMKKDKMKEVEKAEEELNSSYQQYDNSFLNVIIICNVAQGFKRLVDLGLYYVFKDKLHLEPAEIEVLLGIINFPWVVKMVFGIISDNMTFFGSRRKSYFILACSVNLLSLIALMGYSVSYGKYFITGCVFVTQLCMTYCDALSDALVV